MSKSSFSTIFLLLLLNGVLIEMHHAYQSAHGLPDIVMPAASLVRLPKSLHNSSVSEVPLIHEFDKMSMATAAIIFSDER